MAAGVGKAFIQSFSVTYAITNGQNAFIECKEEVERKTPLILGGSFGIGAFITPLVMSAFYKAIKFRGTLDILGVIFSLNALAFTIHAGRNNCGRKITKSNSKDPEEQALLLAIA